MQKHILVLLAAVMLAMPESKADGDTPIPLRIENGTVQDTPVIRNPAYIPMQAIYLEKLTGVLVTFTNYIGDVEVSVSNMTTGAQFDYELDSSCVTALLSVGEDYGIFRIEFITSSGVVYSGEFEI